MTHRLRLGFCLLVAAAAVLAQAFGWVPPLAPPAGPRTTRVRLGAATTTSQEDIRERVRASVSLVDVVKQHVELEAKGDGQWMGCCPFHDDKSPSLSVSDDKGVYHCFSCGAGGDVFKFVSEIQGLSFPEALELLAEEGGVDLQEANYGRGAPNKNHTRLHLALEAAGEYYTSQLLDLVGGVARAHLQERETGAGLATDFMLGYAPAEPGALWEHLRAQGFSNEELVKAGLFTARSLQGRNPPMDRLGGRLVIPIRNPRGQMVGFSGRLLADEPFAKYINTPETAVFKKRTLLYGLDLARPAIRKTGVAVVVEGYFDVIALHGAGLRNAVACMGTAVTVDQIKALRNALPSTDGTIVLVLDSDPAGRRAAERACREVLLPLETQGRLEGLRVKVAELPEGTPAKDPADVVRTYGSQAGAFFHWHVLEPGVSWKEWYARRLMTGDRAGATALAELREDTALFSKRSQALTDFLSQLPPTQKADRTFLSSLLAQEVFPDNEVLRERLTNDLIQQCDEKRRVQTERQEQRQQQQRRQQDQLQQQQQQRQEAQQRQQSQKPPSPPPPSPPPPPPPKQAAPTGASPMRGGPSSPAPRNNAAGRPLPTTASLPPATLSPALASRHLPATTTAASAANSMLDAKRSALADSRATLAYEQSLIELLIADPRARSIVRSFLMSGGSQYQPQPPQYLPPLHPQLLLSTQAHQVLFDWLIQFEDRRAMAAASSYYPPPLGSPSIAALKEQFGMEAPAYHGLLVYFDKSLSREMAPHSPAPLMALLKKALKFLVDVTIARRVGEESELWQRRLLALDGAVPPPPPPGLATGYPYGTRPFPPQQQLRQQPALPGAASAWSSLTASSMPEPQQFVLGDSRAIFEYEQSLVELLIADPRARATVRGFLMSGNTYQHQPQWVQQHQPQPHLLLSTPAHQFLFDWLIQQEDRRAMAALSSYYAPVVMPSIAALKEQFVMEAPAYHGLLVYFDKSLSREMAPHSHVNLMTLLKKALKFLVDVTIARRVGEESELWQRRLQALDGRRAAAAANGGGISPQLPPRQPQYATPVPPPLPQYRQGQQQQQQQQPQQPYPRQQQPYPRPQAPRPPQQQQYQPQQPQPQTMLQRRNNEPRPRWPSETGAGAGGSPPFLQQQQQQPPPPQSPPPPPPPQGVGRER